MNGLKEAFSRENLLKDLNFFALLNLGLVLTAVGIVYFKNPNHFAFGGTSGLSIGHVSPEAAEGGAIGLVEEGDTIEIDIPARRIHLAVSSTELEDRRRSMDAKGDQAWAPAHPRKRYVSKALQAYALMATSAATGAVRWLEEQGVGLDVGVGRLPLVPAAVVAGIKTEGWVSACQKIRFQALAPTGLLYTYPSPRDATRSRMPSSA